MVKAATKWIDGERFAASASSGHAIVVDSASEGRTASGPMELVLMALCACTSTDVVIVLNKKRQPFTSLHVRAEAQRAETTPQVYTNIKLIYSVGGKVDKAAMEKAVKLSEEKYCSVSQMLQKTAKISYEIEYLP